jgi:hypothetical protein
VTRLLILLLAACTACPSPERDRPAAIEHHVAPPHDATIQKQLVGDPLPMVKGATWTYDVAMHVNDMATHTVVDTTFRWTTRVVDAYAADGRRAYRIEGWAGQLADFDMMDHPHQPPAPGLITLVRSFDNYLWSKQPSAELDGADMWFTWPLSDGQRICPDPGSRYCWQVAVEKGRYEVTMRTNPDDETFELTPGIGLTRYIYHHHGTTLDVDARLVDTTGFRPAR